MSKGNIISALDIGTNLIKLLVSSKRPEDSEFEVLYFSQRPAIGMRKGIVIDPERVSEIIQELIKEGESQLQRKLDLVYINIGGSHISSFSSQGLVSISRADQKISQEDVERVLEAAQVLPLPSNKEILEVFVKEFIVDGQAGIKELSEMKGVRLEAKVLILAGFSPYLKNLKEAVLNSNLKIADIIPSPLASARAVLSKKEKELGVALLEIGGGTSGLAVFEEDSLLHLAILPIGSNNITNDIAIVFRTDVEIAERMKIEYGSCFFQGKDKKEKIIFNDQETLTFSRKKLAEVIRARISEIFREANKELRKISKEGKLPGGIVLTGGGVKLPKIVELAKKDFNLPVKISGPGSLSSLEPDPSLATVSGLTLLAADSEKENFSSFGQGLTSKLKRIFRIFLP